VSKSRSRSARKLLARGIDYQRLGKTALADECFRDVLRADAQCLEALHRRVLIALESGRYSEAHQFISAALALDPDDPTTLTCLASYHRLRGENEQALRHYRRVGELCPHSAQAHLRLGEAEDTLGNREAAARSYRRALELEADSPEAHSKLADILRKQGIYAEALELCERAVALDPGRSDTYADLGLVLTDLKRLDAAAEAFERSVALNPNSARTAHFMGYYYQRCGDVRAAAESLRRSVKLDPGLYLAHVSLGSILNMMGEMAGAYESYENARALCPGSAELSFHLGLWHLGQGNFAQGWAGYEQRQEALELRKKFSQPQWKGEPLEGARIFLHAEQGLGDTLQAVRYVPLVAARGGEVTLAVPPRLHRLLEKTEGASRVITDGGAVVDFRWHCPLMSLPLAFATEMNTIPAKNPYVFADPALVKVWGERMAAALQERGERGSTLRIGLAWDGDPKYCQNFRRRIPLEELAPLTFVEGTSFYTLQMGPSIEQVKQLGRRVNLIDLQDEQKDLADAAAIVANLDLVISIDTSIVHLAGSMGKAVWVLLNNSPDWRWLLEREDSPWYPTARLFRQSTMGNWKEVISRVEGELRGLVASKIEMRRSQFHNYEDAPGAPSGLLTVHGAGEPVPVGGHSRGEAVVSHAAGPEASQ